jgi:hypothetical protein
LADDCDKRNGKEKRHASEEHNTRNRVRPWDTPVYRCAHLPGRVRSPLTIRARDVRLDNTPVPLRVVASRLYQVDGDPTSFALGADADRLNVGNVLGTYAGERVRIDELAFSTRRPRLEFGACSEVDFHGAQGVPSTV